MKAIPLSRGLVTIVDNVVYERFKQHRWYAAKRGKKFYAVRHGPKKNGSWTKRYLHREILRLAPGVQADHRNGDGLDNRKCNLRPATSKQNNRAFKRKAAGATSSFRGVSWENFTLSWKAQIGWQQKTQNLGRFSDEKDAARAYNKAAKRLFGEFAHLNKV